MLPDEYIKFIKNPVCGILEKTVCLNWQINCLTTFRFGTL